MSYFRTHNQQGILIPANLQLLRVVDLISFFAGVIFVAITLVLTLDLVRNWLAELLANEQFPGYLRTGAGFLAVTAFAANHWARAKLTKSCEAFYASLRRTNP